MPKLSVIVPFYGVEDYLAECLDSILAQTFDDFECILVDDGSTDGSIDIARVYEARDPRLRIVQQQNQGLGPARNTGVRHATGEYLMFVDSDDLLGPRAFSRLVGVLEESGSDFAVGNAWRFTRARGTWPSWSHTVPCRDDRRRTTVREFPALIRDRMAWNKVYRASFWRAHGYEFPAIRYEDYPITLRAHLDASAVDIVSDRVYLWRDRESGESITQQTTNARNAEERAISAGLVLDLLERPDVPAVVREDTHAFLIDIDIVALAAALLHVGWGDRAHLETVVRRLALRLHPQAPGRVQRLAGLMHTALREDDFEFVRALARWREGGDRRALIVELRKRPAQVPAAALAVLPRRRPPSLATTRPLKVTMTGAVEEAGRFVVNADVTLRDAFYLTAKIRAQLRAGETVVPLLVEPARREHSLKVRVVITPADVAALAGATGLVEVGADRYALHWVGPVAVPDHTELPPVLALGEGRWAVAALLDEASNHLHVRALDAPLVAEGRKDADGEAELRLNRAAELVVHRPDPTPDVQWGASDFVTLRAPELTAGDPPDDPVSRVALRALTDSSGRPVYASRFPGAIESDGVRVRVVPNRRGEAELRVGPTERRG